MIILNPLLQAFLATVKYKTVHAAARTSHLTQTAVTQRIKTLEQRLGASLFIRSRRGMMLTSEGEALLRYCQQIQGLEKEALSQISGCDEKTINTRITGPYAIMRSRIIPECMAVMRKFPNLLLHFDINDHPDTVRFLRNGHSQFAIIEEATLADEMDYKLLQPEQYILVASTKWKHRRLKDIITNERIIDFDPADQLTFNYLKKFRLFKYANKNRYFINRTDCLALAIANGIGYSVLPEAFAQPYLKQKSLMMINDHQKLPVPFVLAWYPRHQPPPYFSAIIDACK